MGRKTWLLFSRLILEDSALTITHTTNLLTCFIWSQIASSTVLSRLLPTTFVPFSQQVHASLLKRAPPSPTSGTTVSMSLSLARQTILLFPWLLSRNPLTPQLVRLSVKSTSNTPTCTPTTSFWAPCSSSSTSPCSRLKLAQPSSHQSTYTQTTKLYCLALIWAMLPSHLSLRVPSSLLQGLLRSPLLPVLFHHLLLT